MLVLEGEGGMLVLEGEGGMSVHTSIMCARMLVDLHGSHRLGDRVRYIGGINQVGAARDGAGRMVQRVHIKRLFCKRSNSSSNRSSSSSSSWPTGTGPDAS